MTKKLALAAIVLLAVGLLPACAGPTPTPIPTPTPTFEQKRTDVVRYLKAFDSIENSYDATISQLRWPESTGTTLNSLATNAAYNQYYSQQSAATDGAIKRLGELQPSSLEPDTAPHLLKAKAVYQETSRVMNSLREAFAAGDETRFTKVIGELLANGLEAKALNRATEQLMLRYNISDAEVSYRFRGK